MGTLTASQKKDMTFHAMKSWQENGKKYVEGVASDETVDRAGDVILATAWQLDNFLKNPVLLWAHDYKTPPVGKIIDIWVDSGRLRFKAEFADTEFAREIAQLYTDGYLNTFSVGFLPLEYEPNKDTGGYIYKKVELLEISAVPVPANPNAVAVLRAKGIEPLPDRNTEEKGGGNVETEEKAVIPYKKRPLAPENTPWDAAAEVKKATPEDLHEMCAWYDDKNPDVKQAYKLPHHKADGKYSTVWRGVATAMAVLFGAMGGVNVPEKDKKGIYNHLAKHYADFGKEPPEWGKSWEEVQEHFDFLTEKEIQEMVDLWEGGDEKMETPKTEELAVSEVEEMEAKDTAETETAEPTAEVEQKAGAVLSRKNAEKLLALAGKVKDAIQVLDEAVAELTDFVKSATRSSTENTEDTGEEEKLYTETEVMAMLKMYRESLLNKLGGRDGE